MVYTGLDGPNRVTVVNVPGDRFLISDTAPITSGPGCIPATVPAGLFGVSCTAPRNPNGSLSTFRVNPGGGDDVVNNSSSASMLADGGRGNDTLNGGFLSDSLRDSFGGDTLRGNGGSDVLLTELSQADGLTDTLDGGAGDDDLWAGAGNDVLHGGDGNDFLRGGSGGDLLDVGPGAGDTVSYLDVVPRLLNTVSMDGSPNDGEAVGSTIEHDNVLAGAETIVGGNGPDVLFGDSTANHLIGNEGDDRLIGFGGADLLDAGGGDDILTGNGLTGPAADGAIDTLDGGSATDTCRKPIDEADVLISCETVKH